jgi:hypothetical protein
MEHNEVSIHRVRVFRFVRSTGRWVTAKEIAAASAVAERTARHHAFELVKLGLFDQAEVFPGHRYRLSAQAEKRNKAYLLRMSAAEEVFFQEPAA